MSGPVHFIFGFGLGLLFWYLSNRKFDARRVLVFGMSNWYGPDFGVLLTVLLESSGVNSDLAWNIGFRTIHSYFFWPIFALLIAAIWKPLLKIELSIPKMGQNIWTKHPKPLLSFIDIYKIVVAGGYLHFFVDDTFPPHIVYRTTTQWGVWENAEVHWSMALVGIIIFIYIYLTIWFLHAAYWSPRKQCINLFCLFFVFILANTLLLGFFVWTTGKTMAVGDEIDFGLNIWLAFLFFAPLLIAASTIDPFKTEFKTESSMEQKQEPNLETEPSAPSFLKENKFIVILFFGVALMTWAVYAWNQDVFFRML